MDISVVRILLHHRKPKIYLANRSKLYRHDISLLVVAVNVEHSQKEIEKEFYIEIPRLKLTLVF